MCIPVRVSENDFDTGIGIVRYVHSLIGLAGTTISNKDVDNQWQSILAKDKALSTDGSDLNQLRQNVLQLMIMLCQKYLSIQSSIHAHDVLGADPFKDDSTMMSEDISSGSSEHDDDSTWDPREDEYINSNNNSCDNDVFGNKGDEDDSDRDSIQSAHSTDQVKTKPRFDYNDVAVLNSTNGLLCPGDIVLYRLRNPRGKPKMSSIVSLLDPNTPDNKVITLQNGAILQPFIHDVKRQKMYGGGACGHLTDPLSVWMKMERCTFLVGCTSNYNAYDRDNSDNDSDISNETTNDGGDNDNCDDLNGKQPRQSKINRL